MEERLQKSLESFNYRMTLSNQLEQLKFKAQTKLVVHQNGGTFKIDRELIAFVMVLLDNDQETAILFDDNGVPTLIEDMSKFKDTILETYNSVTNDIYDEYSKIMKSRRIATMFDIKND